MAGDKKKKTVREAVGIFFDSESLQEAVNDMLSAGFSKTELGLLAGELTVRQKLGHLFTEVNESSDDPKAPRTAFVEKESTSGAVNAVVGGPLGVAAILAGGAVVASAGVLGGAFAVAAAGVAAVGGFGALTAAVIGKSDADYLQEQLDAGHLLLFVRTPDEHREKRAIEILLKHSAYDPRVYTVPASEPE